MLRTMSFTNDPSIGPLIDISSPVDFSTPWLDESVIACALVKNKDKATMLIKKTRLDRVKLNTSWMGAGTLPGVI